VCLNVLRLETACDRSDSPSHVNIITKISAAIHASAVSRETGNIELTRRRGRELWNGEGG